MNEYRNKEDDSTENDDTEEACETVCEPNGDAVNGDGPETVDAGAAECDPAVAETEDLSADVSVSDAAQSRASAFRSKFFVWFKNWAHRWFIDAFNGMAQGLFATLIAGTILGQIGSWIGDNAFGHMVVAIANMAKMLMGAGIGVGIAHALKASKLTMFTAAVAGMVGAFSDKIVAGTLTASFLPGNPIGAYIVAIIAVEVAKLYAGKTKLDIILIPLGMMIVCLPAIYIAQPFIMFVNLIGKGIELATTAQPILMGIIISVVMGILLTMPTSSAAIWIAICAPYGTAIPPAILLAGGAAVVGCCAHMVGFAVASFKENGWGGLIAQGIGTSMLQIPNIMKKPIIMVPAIIASAVVGPLATGVFGLYCDATGGGMGTAGFVGVIQSIQASLAGGVNGWMIGFGVALLMFILPAIISWGVAFLFRKKGWIKDGDMKLDL